jgi:hypothetical protein
MRIGLLLSIMRIQANPDLDLQHCTGGKFSMELGKNYKTEKQGTGEDERIEERTKYHRIERRCTVALH